LSNGICFSVYSNNKGVAKAIHIKIVGSEEPCRDNPFNKERWFLKEGGN
jgi:hypothetical protein